MKKHYVAVVGGANMDLNGISETEMISGDSNPGKIADAPGGVGRNIAENLAHLGEKVRLVTALGGDLSAEVIRRNCAAAGIDLTWTVTMPGERTGTYLALAGPDGDLYAAISDMRIYDHVTPEHLLAPCMDMLNEAELVITEANMPESVLRYLAENCTAPLTADPVSVKKSRKLRPCMNRLLAIKPNRAEALELTGVDPYLEGGLKKAAAALLASGVKNVFISLGPDGVFYDDGAVSGIQPCCPAKIVNTTGCGDAFLSAASLALVRGSGIAEAALLGQAASAICAENAGASPAEMHMADVRKRAGLL